MWTIVLIYLIAFLVAWDWAECADWTHGED